MPLPTLNLSVCLKDNCKKLSVTDTTGGYSASNTTGWGSSNDDRTDVTAASIVIKDSAAAVVHTEDITDQIDMVDWYADFTYEDIALTLADGQYTATYSITTPGDSGGTTETTVKFYVYCVLKCCVHKRLHAAVVAYGNDPCKYADKLNFANYLWALLKDFEDAARGCNFNKAKTAFDKLTALCATEEDCSCK
jgi:hypothetical protein